MFENIKRELCIKQLNLKEIKNYKKGRLTPFDDEYYKELQGTIVNGFPVSIDIKYLKPNIKPGKCWDRSLRMFFAMENSVLVRGSLNYFRVKGEVQSPNHGWVERDGYVYDPTFRIKYDKDTYYKMFDVKDVYKVTKEEYISDPDAKKYYEESKLPIEEYKPYGSKRIDLMMSIPFLEAIAEYHPDMKKELEEYLRLIEYDEGEVQQEIDDKLRGNNINPNFKELEKLMKGIVK